MARGGQPAQGWYSDPTGRHDLRRWDGDGWSEWVIDAGRRSFDDIDGCGGAPQGAAVEVDRPRRRPGLRTKSTRFWRGSRTSTTPSSADALLPPASAAASALPIAVVVAIAAGIVGSGIVGLGERDAFASLGLGPSDELTRRFLLPLVVALAGFEGALWIGLVVLRRRLADGGRASRPWTALVGVRREEILRGLIAFLLALFARTFVISTMRSPFGLGVRPVGPWWLFVVEALLLVGIAPVVEERLFRGVLLVGLRSRSRPVVAILGQAAIYGAALSWSGVATGRMAAALGGFAVGAVFGWFTHTTNDLRPVILGHVMLNGWFLVERLLAA